MIYKNKNLINKIMDNLSKIDELKKKNEELNKELNKEYNFYLTKIENLKREREINYHIIQELCEHSIEQRERIIEYGERTKHQCRICYLIW